MVPRHYIRIVFVSCFVVFILNKFAFRPLFAPADPPGAMLTIAYSLPNFLEAVMGTILISGVLIFIRERLANQFSRLTDSTLYLMASAMAATYVLTQEFELHNVGGNNVYDSNDVVASILGLVVVNLMLIRFGMSERPIHRG